MSPWNLRASRRASLLLRAWLLLSLLLLCLAMRPALAQQQADPPDRVARLSLTNGMVSFSAAGDDVWTNADVNRPLTQGDKLWTDGGARAELDTGNAAVRLDGLTSLNVLSLGERVAQFQLAQGTANVAVRELLEGEFVELDTPNLAVTLRQAGSYRILVDNNGATTVAVRSGEAEVTGEGGAYLVKPGQAYRFIGNNLSNYLLSALPAETDFDRWSAERERALTRSASARYVSPVVIGYQELDTYGSWRQDPEYGSVWTPTRVAVDWAPYHDGRWVWVQPWGWTWVDNAPWGFAPFHYGRWVSLRGHWCWVPGPRHVRPVYAPALVAFIGGSGLRVAGGPGMAWFPLGPRDVYRPPYHVSRGYFTRVNVSNTHINVTQISNHYDHPNPANTVYVNRRVPGAVAALPATAFAQAHTPTRGIMRVSPEVAAQGQVGAAPPTAPPRPGPGPTPGAGHRPQPPESVRERPLVTRSPPPVTVWPGAAHRSAPSAPPGSSGPAPAAPTPASPAPVGPMPGGTAANPAQAGTPAPIGPAPGPRPPTTVTPANPAINPGSDNERPRRGRPDERERTPQNQMGPQPPAQPTPTAPVLAQPQPAPVPQPRPRPDQPARGPETPPPAVRPAEPAPLVERRGMERERRGQMEGPQRDMPQREGPQRPPEVQRAPEPQPQPRARPAPMDVPQRNAVPAPAPAPAPQPRPPAPAPAPAAAPAPAPAPAPARTEATPRHTPGGERKNEEDRRRGDDKNNRN